MHNEVTKRELKALTLLNEMFNTHERPRRHRVWTLSDSPFQTLEDLIEVAGHLPSTERTSGGRAVWRLTRPDVKRLPNKTDNKPYWSRSTR